MEMIHVQQQEESKRGSADTWIDRHSRPKNLQAFIPYTCHPISIARLPPQHVGII